MTATRQNVTARKPSVWSVKPPNSAEKHLDTVEDLKRRGFTNHTMQEWTFANDNGNARKWRLHTSMWSIGEIMREENIGYLLWGKGRHREKAILPGVLQTPSWSRKSLSA